MTAQEYDNKVPARLTGNLGTGTHTFSVATVTVLYLRLDLAPFFLQALDAS